MRWNGETPGIERARHPIPESVYQGRRYRLKENTSLRSSIVWFGLDRQLT